MDHQDQSIHTPGNEGHGVYVCRKCGWPFPNSHPSARHRRAHKRICGTVEGYTLVDSEETVSDDEHLSDEDHKLPSAKVLETSNNGKGSGGIGERSNRSEDELYSDAATEFFDSSGSGIEERFEDVRESATNVEKGANDNPNVSQSFEDGGIADIIQPPSISMDSSQMGNPEVPESTTNQLGSTPQSSSTISSMTSSISDCITEESVVCSHDRKGPPSDSNAIKPESPTDALQENEKTNASEDVTKWSLAYVAQETDTKGTGETNLDRNVTDSMVSPSRFAGESFETVSKLEETVGKAPDPVPADIAVESEEEHDDGSSSKMSQNDLAPEVDSSDHVSASIGNSQIKVAAPQEVNHVSSGFLIDGGNIKEEGNDNIDVLSVPGDSANQVNASIDASQVMGGAAEGIPYANSGNIIEGCNRKEEGNENVNILSVLDDTSIIDPPENIIEDLKENKGVRLQEYAILDSCAKIADKEDGAEDSASEENSSTFQSRQLSEGTERPSSDILEDSGEREGGRSKTLVNEVLVEEEADVSPIKVTIDEIGASVNSSTFQSRQLSEGTERPSSDILEDSGEREGGRSKTVVNEVLVEEEADVSPIKVTIDEIGASVNSSTFQSRQLSEGTERPSSDILEDSGERESGRSKAVVNEVLVEEETDASPIKVTTDEIGASVEVVAQDIDENHIVRTHEEQEINNIRNNEIQVNFPENTTKFSSDAGINQATNLLGVDDAGNCEKAWTEGFDAIGDNNGIGATEKDYTKISKSNSKSAGILSESLVDPTLDLPQGDEAGVHEKGKIEKCDIGGIETREGPKEDELSMKSKLTSESTSNFHESQTVADDIVDGSVKKLPEHECLHLDEVSYSSIVGNNSFSDAGIKEDEFSGNDKVEVESLGVSAANESYHGGDVNSLQKTLEDQMIKESHVSPLETEPSVQSSDAVEDNHAREFGGGASVITSESLEGDSNFVKQQSAASAVDVSVDSFSQTDSLEGNWGSVSVLSIQSDAPGVGEAEAFPSSDSLALTEAEKSHLQKPKAAPEGRHSDNMFEAPSFMTLVEPTDGGDQETGASEIQTGQNLQQQSTSLQAGWFPSLTNVVNESQGRKKNEEIIAKVTNWSTGKQHTPLKSLLGEASLESKAKSKKPKETPAPAIQKDETVPKDNGAIATTVNSILDTKSPTSQAAKTETKREWNSPARYPSEIKREKRKVKGRPYWVQFVCCTSIN